MNIRWRLGTLTLQLLLLLSATWVVTGRFYSAEAWFAAGLFALVINPQILEPYYPRPGDVLGNSLVGLLLCGLADKTNPPWGWQVLIVALSIWLTLGVIALVFGAGQQDGSFSRLARAATVVARMATSRVIYSAVFWLSLLAFRSTTSPDFWLLASTWALVTAVGVVNWQAAWGSLSGGPVPCAAEGMLGPSLLLINSPTLPPAGTPIRLVAKDCSANGVVLNRIRRGSDFWGQVHIDDPSMCERLATRAVITLMSRERSDETIIGAVLSPSSDTQLQFVSTKDLETGTVVAVIHGTEQIYYQIRWAAIEDAKVKGGAHQVVRAYASQLGTFNPSQLRLQRYRWVPTPGGGVFLPATTSYALSKVPDGWLRLGTLIGTQIPLFLDCDAACQGHLAILGMTRMGKTTLALRLARHLASTRRVTILDQTGEWISKRGLPAYAGQSEDSTPGLSVLEPKKGANTADEAFKYLKSWVDLAYSEYTSGVPVPRVLIMDEAHQFAPEPAGMGFNSPGRESALGFGQLMMQVRKYGITIILVSQRTAVVGKSALSQCENLIAFKSVDQTGLEYLEAILGFDARKALPTLRHAEALVFGPAITSDLAAGITVDEN